MRDPACSGAGRDAANRACTRAHRSCAAVSAAGRRGPWGRRPNRAAARRRARRRPRRGRRPRRPAARVHATGREQARGRRRGPASALRIADHRDVLEHDPPAVDEARPPDRPIQTTRPPGSTRSTARAGSSRRVGGIDHGVERQRRQRRGRPDVLEPERRARTATDGSRRADEVHLDAAGPRHQRDQQPDRARVPSDQQPLAGADAGRLDAPARRCRRARPAPPPCRRSCRGGRGATIAGTASCSASAPGQPLRIPTSNRSAHRCWRPSRHRSQRPQPSIVSPVTRRPSQAPVDAGADGADTVPHHSCPIRSG